MKQKASRLPHFFLVFGVPSYRAHFSPIAPVTGLIISPEQEKKKIPHRTDHELDHLDHVYHLCFFGVPLSRAHFPPIAVVAGLISPEQKTIPHRTDHELDHLDHVDHLDPICDGPSYDRGGVAFGYLFRQWLGVTHERERK